MTPLGWRLAIRNAEHGRLASAADRAWKLLSLASAMSADAPDRPRAVAAARAAWLETIKLTDTLWARMAADRGVSVEDVVRGNPDAEGQLALIGRVRVTLDALEAESASTEEPTNDAAAREKRSNVDSLTNP